MLIFGRYFMRGDISEEPTVPQKLMLLDNSQRVLMATSRFVLKTVGLIIRMLQDIVTHMKPVHAGQQDEILFTTPTEGHLQPTVGRLYSIIYNNIAFRSLVSESRSGDKPELVIRSQLKFYFRIDGSTGSDVNMVNIHPRKIYGDEQAFGILNTHRSRLAALHPGGQVVYAGVPNDIRTSPFYALDATKDGDSWSRHKMSVLKANPLFLKKDAKTKRHLRQLVKDFGGRNSPQYKTQILGEWGDEASSSFPPGSIAWFTEGHPYFITILSGQQVKTALRQGNLPMELKVPHVRPKRACIGWDYGFSPDPTTFLVAIQIGDDPVWYTYCRISLYQTDMDSQFEVLKYLVTGVLDNRVAMISTDRQDGYQKMIHEVNIHIFSHKCKLSNPGGQVEMDLETGEFIPDDMRDDPEIVTKRRLKKTVYQGRKYYMTAVMRRMMQATLLKADDYPRLMLGYDSEFENELVLVVERRTDKKIVYDLPKQGRTIGRVTPDQILDAARYLCDSIVTVDATGFRREPDMTELISEMGWGGKRL